MRPYDEVFAEFQDVKALQSSIKLLSWDQQLLMPQGGLSARTEHLLRLTKLEHQTLTSDKLSEKIEDAL